MGLAKERKFRQKGLWRGRDKERIENNSGVRTVRYFSLIKAQCGIEVSTKYIKIILRITVSFSV